MTHPDSKMKIILTSHKAHVCPFLCLLQGNEAFVGEADIRPLSRLPSDCGAGGQLVPPQALACQKRPGAN